MTDKIEIAIVRIEAAGTIAKGPVPWSRVPGYVLPIVYVLEDGQRIEATDRFSLKRDAVKRLATRPTIPEDPMLAMFSDGEYSGTKTTYYIGPRR